MKRQLMTLILMCSVAIPVFSEGSDGASRSSQQRDSKQVLDKEILSERMPSSSEPEYQPFRPDEWQVDVFGTYADTDRHPHYHDGFGGGVGVNKFWTENWGAGLEGYWWEALPGDRVLHSVDAHVIYRYPFQELRLAPYVFVGPGGHFNGEDEASGHGGGGFEWRFMDNIGFFADARYTFTTGPDDFALYRTGLRFVF